MLKRLLKALSGAILLLILGGGVVLATISWVSTIAVLSPVTYSMFPFVCSSNNSFYSAEGYFTYASGNDTRVLQGSAEIPRMIADNKTLFACATTTGVTQSLQYTFGNNATTSFPVITGNGGYITVSDNDSLEGGSNTAWIVSGYIDTTAGINKNLVYKQGSCNISVSPTINQRVIAQLLNTDYLAFTRANSDLVSIPDDPAFTFNTAGVDQPFSVVTIAYILDATSSSLVSKMDSATTREWVMLCNGSDYLTFILWHADGSAYIGRRTADFAPYESQWVHLVATYDGSKTAAGINIYINGMDSDVADLISGAYTGMSDTPSVVQLGNDITASAEFLSGREALVKIFNVALTPTEVLADYNNEYRTTNLVAKYNLNEGTGLPQDSSGNGHHATSNLADWATDGYIKATQASATVASGNHTVIVSANITHLAIAVDSTTQNSTLLLGTGADNTTYDWILCSANATPWLTYISENVSGVEVLRYQPLDMIQGTVMPNRASGGNYGAITWGSNPDGISANMTGLLPVTIQAPGGAGILDQASPDVLPLVDIGLGTEPVAPTNPLSPLITGFFAPMFGLPVNIIWFFLSWIAILGVFGASAYFFHHLAISGICACGMMCLLAGVNIMPRGWIILGIIGLMALVITEIRRSQ